MPGLNQTGPLGHGPKTGRGSGFCAVDPQADAASRMPTPGSEYGFGRARGFRSGMGRGHLARRGGFFAQPNPQDERSVLESQREALRSRLNVIDQRRVESRELSSSAWTRRQRVAADKDGEAGQSGC